MALLVNYEGTYLPPQKLWYLVDGVWKEVVNVFENTAQQELAVLDQERIKQDQVVTALITRENELLAKIDGSDPTIPIETDPAKIEAILNEIDTIELQLSITKTEQVVLTKKLFEAKAQMEYLKLVTEGEQALEKIAKNVTNPSEWGVIRIAPQSTLDERLEIVIQHGLDTNDRIFNYGLVYYRLYKLSSADQNDNLDYLKDQFKRRLNKAAYDLGIEPTNYILTIDNIQNVYVEVNQFVNSGAQRIEDYLASIKDQQKYILDSIEEAKVSMDALQAKVVAGTLTPVDGKIIAAAVNDDLKVPIGDVLLNYQSVTTFDQLVSTSTLQDIAAGTKDIADYPGIIKLNADATALNEKIGAVQNFLTTNKEIQNELTSGQITFNLNVLTTKKATLTPSKLLFWTSPLGDTTVATSAGALSYSQTYTSSGTYKFKNNELVTLSTTYSAIINALMSHTNTIVLGVTFKSGDQPRIINVEKGGLYVYGKDSVVNPRAIQTSIVNVNSASIIDTKTEQNTKANDKEQPHTKIVFVKENGYVETPGEVIITVTQPIINGLFYANTEDSQVQASTHVSTVVYDYAFDIHPIHTLDYVDPLGSFSFNAKEIPLSDWFKNNDNIISQVKESIGEATFSFNTKEIPLTNWFKNNDNIISQVKETITSQLLTFNAFQIPIEAMKYNDNIIAQDKTSLLTPINAFSFNTKQTNNYSNVKNGYGQDTTYVATTTQAGATNLNGISIIKLVSSSDISTGGATLINAANKEYPSLLKTVSKSRDTKGDYARISYYSKTRIIITSQTGLVILESKYPDDTMNALYDAIPRMITPKAVNIVDIETFQMDKLNMMLIDQPRIMTMTADKTLNAEQNYKLDTLNYCADGTTQIVTQNATTVATDSDLYSASSLVNKDISSIVNPAIQLNPGVVLS